jgi:hypothetical protein
MYTVDRDEFRIGIEIKYLNFWAPYNDDT